MPIIKPATVSQISRQQRVEGAKEAEAIKREQQAFEQAEIQRVKDEFNKWGVTPGKTYSEYVSQYENDPNYEVVRDNSGNVTKIQQKPKEYTRQRDGDRRQTATYSPHIIEFKNGKPLKEVFYTDYATDKDDDYMSRTYAPLRTREYDPTTGKIKQETLMRVVGEDSKSLKPQIYTYYDPTTGTPTKREENIFYKEDVMRTNLINYGEGGTSSFTSQDFDISKRGSIAESRYILENTSVDSSGRVTVSDAAKSKGITSSDYQKALNRLTSLTTTGGQTGKLAATAILEAAPKGKPSQQLSAAIGSATYLLKTGEPSAQTKSFISRDPTKSYFGREVFRTAGGRITDIPEYDIAKKIQRELSSGADVTLGYGKEVYAPKYKDVWVPEQGKFVKVKALDSEGKPILERTFKESEPGKGSLLMFSEKTPSLEEPKSITKEQAIQELLYDKLGLKFLQPPEQKQAGPTIESFNEWAKEYNEDLDKIQKQEAELNNKYSDLFKTKITYQGETKPGESSIPSFEQVFKSPITGYTPRYKEYLKEKTKLDLEKNKFYNKYNIPGIYADIQSLTVLGGAKPAYDVGTKVTGPIPFVKTPTISDLDILGTKEKLGIIETGKMQGTVMPKITDYKYISPMDIPLIKEDLVKQAGELGEIQALGPIGRTIAYTSGIFTGNKGSIEKAGDILSKYRAEEMVKAASGETPIVDTRKQYLDLSSLYIDLPEQTEKIYTVEGDTILDYDVSKDRIIKPIPLDKMKVIRQQPNYLIDVTKEVPKEYLIPASPADIQRNKKLIMDSLESARKRAIIEGNKSEAKRFARDAAIVGGITLLTGGSAPLIGGAAKIINSLPVRTVLTGLYGLDVGTKVISGISDIRKGNTDAGASKLGLATSGILGVITGGLAGAKIASKIRPTPKIKSTLNNIESSKDPEIIKMSKILNTYKSEITKGNPQSQNNAAAAMNRYLFLRNKYLASGKGKDIVKLSQIRSLESQYTLNSPNPVVAVRAKPKVDYVESYPGYVKGKTYLPKKYDRIFLGQTRLSEYGFSESSPVAYDLWPRYGTSYKIKSLGKDSLGTSLIKTKVSERLLPGTNVYGSKYPGYTGLDVSGVVPKFFKGGQTPRQKFLIKSYKSIASSSDLKPSDKALTLLEIENAYFSPTETFVIPKVGVVGPERLGWIAPTDGSLPMRVPGGPIKKFVDIKGQLRLEKFGAPGEKLLAYKKVVVKGKTKYEPIVAEYGKTIKPRGYNQDLYIKYRGKWEPVYDKLSGEKVWTITRQPSIIPKEMTRAPPEGVQTKVTDIFLYQQPRTKAEAKAIINRLKRYKQMEQDAMIKKEVDQSIERLERRAQQTTLIKPDTKTIQRQKKIPSRWSPLVQVQPKTTSKTTTKLKPTTKIKPTTKAVVKTTQRSPTVTNQAMVKRDYNTYLSRLRSRSSIKPIVIPITSTRSLTEVTPMTKITPTTKITPITKITPTSKITPITKITPIVDQTPITDQTPLTKTTPITQVTPITYIVPIPTPTPPPPSRPGSGIQPPEDIIRQPPPEVPTNWMGMLLRGKKRPGSLRSTGARSIYNKIKDQFAVRKSKWSSKI